MAPQIVVDRLSKQYRIGRLQQDTTFRERLVTMAKQPLGRSSATAETMWALKDVSFDVEPGEVVGIVGRNGAGKSTLLKILSKITYPTTGSMSVRGRVAALLEVGTGFHEELTGRENIFLNGSILGMSRADVVAKFDEIVAFSGVERFLDTPIKRYSTGMRLRLGFAVAAHLDPEVLVVDEVLAVGDAGFQKKCLDAMQSLRSGGRTVLFVSHNMAAVENLCTRGIWIDDGKVRLDGTARETIEAYMSTFAGASATVHDLTDWHSRRGTGDIQYTGLEFLGPDQQPKNLIRCGDPLTLRFHYRVTNPVPRPSFGFRLLTELGTLVTDTSTWWHHGVVIPWLAPGDGYIDLEIEALNLLPARYHLSLFLTGPDQKVYDVLEHCTVVDVEVSDIYGSGRVIGGRFGIVYIPQRWRLNGSRIDKYSDLSHLSVPV